MSLEPRRIALGVLFAGSFATFVATTARTIGWWDDAHYALLAATLSITNPPGSLLLTVLGWLWTRLLWCPPFAFQLHVLAALLGAGTVTGIAWCTMRAVRVAKPWHATLAGLAAGAWLLSSYHFWTYATQFTPYTLTALFTALLLMAFLRWWDRAEGRDDVPGLVLVAVLLGLDFSVHRTNQLLAPGFALGVALRRPGLVRRPLAVAGLVLAYGAAVCAQVGYWALSARQPPIDMADIHSLRDVYHFVRLDPIGGGFLVALWPRRADFLRVQLADWGSFLWTNLGAVPVTRWAAVALTIAGAVALCRRSRRLAIALLALLLCAGLGAVLYFNRPATYMRPLDRHYLPSLVVLAVFIGAGFAALAGFLRARPVLLRLAPPALALALVAWNVAVNRPRCDRSHTRYTETFARDLLEPLPADAILFTNGDNDSLPLYFMQQVEHVRPDVLVVSVPMLWLPNRQRALARRDTAFAGVAFGEHPAGALVSANRWRRPVHVAVTVAHEAAPELPRDLVLEGLSSRMLPPGSAARGDSALVRFVYERLPRAGLRDRTQLIEPEVEPLLANYGYCGIQLVRGQLDRGDAHAAYVTLELLDRELTGARLGPSAVQFRTFVDGWRTELQDRAKRRGISP